MWDNHHKITATEINLMHANNVLYLQERLVHLIHQNRLKSHAKHFFQVFTSNKHLHIWMSRAQHLSTTWGCYFSSNHHPGVVACSTLETCLNDHRLWCIGSCVVCYNKSMSTSPEFHPHRCHTLRWYCCPPGHSNTRGWAICTLGTHINNGGVKLKNCAHKSENIAPACIKQIDISMSSVCS